VTRLQTCALLCFQAGCADRIVPYPDTGCDPAWYADADGDGFGNDLVSSGCDPGPTATPLPGDCDDSDPAVHPLAQERCNGRDDDCDGMTDDEGAIDVRTWYADRDDDGFGDPLLAVTRCEAPGGYVRDGGDCDDTDPAVSPAASERCNGFDDDCDGRADEPGAVDAPTWYADEDGDGYGDPQNALRACTQPSGYLLDARDCDDSDPGLNPETRWYVDYDGDGYGNGGLWVAACQQPEGRVRDGSDCDDRTAEISPGAEERCNDLDDDCDGEVDESDAVDAGTWYADADQDGYGDPKAGAAACEQPSGYVADDSDCDDGQELAHPNADEVCDGIDNDCDGLADEDDPDVQLGDWHADADGDGYGDADQALTATSCSPPSGYVVDDSDCDDQDPAIHPEAIEVATDGVDNNCDGDLDFFSLSNAEASFHGEVEGEGTGPVAAAGDVNGDGYDDILVGSPQADYGQLQTGSASLWLGPVSGSFTTGEGHARLWGIYDLDYAGDALAGPGDVDGDGYDDILVGAYGYAGAFLVLGPITGSSTLASADATWYCEYWTDDAGESVAAAGDMDGDGLPDFLVGASDHTGIKDREGAAYMVSGLLTGSHSLADASAKLIGDSADDGFGRTLAGVGDFDGDGYADLLAGALDDDEAGYEAGAAHLVLGPISGTRQLDSDDLKLLGEEMDERAGRAVAGPGDVDGDGLDDLLVGGTASGTIYLLLGNASVSSGSQSLADSDAFLTGATYSAPLSAADMNRDGLADILVGVRTAVGSTDGDVYVFLGPVSGSSSMSEADFIVTGTENGGGAGSHVAGAGDVDGDGYEDLLIGAESVDGPARYSGAAYLVLGGSF